MAVEYTQNSIHPKRVKQTTGQGEEDLMSQKALTDKFATVDAAIAGAGTGIFAPVTDLVALKALDTTTAADWPDKWAIYVESVRFFYALDRESAAADDGDTVIAPTVGTGRWHRKVIPLATSLQDGLMSKESAAALPKKADKPAAFTAGNLPQLGAAGNLEDSGKKTADFIDVANVSAAPAGQEKTLVIDEFKTVKAGGLLIDKLRSDLLAALQGAAYNAENITTVGGALGSNANLNGQYGYNGTEVIGKRRSYICTSHNADTATWKRYTENVHLDAADDAILISELEDGASWSAGNTKTVTAASVQGDNYVSTTTNYTYFCYDGVGKKWRRVIDTPNAIELYITDINLKAGIDAHDFATTPIYDASALAGEKGKQGQKYYNETNNTLFECFAAAKWIKVR